MPMRILVVDDDLSTLAFMQDALSAEGHLVSCASTSATARIALRQEPIDLLILDLRLEHPQASENLLDNLRTDSTTAGLPVLIYSADAHALHEKEGEFHGLGCAVLSKPFALEDLLDRVVWLTSTWTQRETAP